MNEVNLCNWKSGGHQDGLRAREQRESLEALEVATMGQASPPIRWLSPASSMRSPVSPRMNWPARVTVPRKLNNEHKKKRLRFPPKIAASLRRPFKKSSGYCVYADSRLVKGHGVEQALKESKSGQGYSSVPDSF